MWEKVLLGNHPNTSVSSAPWWVVFPQFLCDESNTHACSSVPLFQALRFKKAHVTHPEVNSGATLQSVKAESLLGWCILFFLQLKATFQLPLIGVKKNPQSPMYTQLGVITKGTIIEVRCPEMCCCFVYPQPLSQHSCFFNTLWSAKHSLVFSWLPIYARQLELVILLGAWFCYCTADNLPSVLSYWTSAWLVCSKRSSLLNGR